jgi:hypothetical protein
MDLTRGDYYRAVGAPEVAMVLRDNSSIFGHLGLYAREVKIVCERLEVARFARPHWMNRESQQYLLA